MYGKPKEHGEAIVLGQLWNGDLAAGAHVDGLLAVETFGGGHDALGSMGHGEELINLDAGREIAVRVLTQANASPFSWFSRTLGRSKTSKCGRP